MPLRAGDEVAQVGRMSLNRFEQRVRDYVEGNPEEKRYWQDKVAEAARGARDDHAAARDLAERLWGYCEERTAVVPAFLDGMRAEGLWPTSMRNLAEYWLRVWVAPRPKRSSGAGTYDGI